MNRLNERWGEITAQQREELYLRLEHGKYLFSCQRMHLLDCRQQIRGLSRLLICGCSEIPPSLEKGCYDFCNNESETFDDKLKPVWENKKKRRRKEKN